MKKIFKKITTFLNLIKFDENEEHFINTVTPLSANSNEYTLVQIPEDYYYLVNFYKALKSNKLCSNKIISYWPYNIYYLPEDSDFLSLKFLTELVNIQTKSYFLHKKWAKLYRAIGAEESLTLTTSNIFLKIKLLAKSFSIFRSLQTKEDTLNLIYKDIKIGDLVYDTYLRYCRRPTLDLTDKRLVYIIYKGLEAYHVVDNTLENYNIKNVLNTYAVYVQHGVVARLCVKRGGAVYVDGNLRDNLKKLSEKDLLHTPNYPDYRMLWDNLSEDKNKLLEESHKCISERFNGGIDRMTSYMKKSSFSENIDIESLDKVEGVMFLHDFVDSPHIYRTMVFNDFWEWTIYTLDFIRDHSLKVAVKPHPNQGVDSVCYVNQLRARYPEILWLDPNLSNQKIFSSNIKYVLSVYGTVLYEAPFFGKVPIASGEHPSMFFDMVYTASNKEEYSKLLMNASVLKPKNKAVEEMLAFYYIHRFKGENPFDLVDKSVELKKFKDAKSDILKIEI